MAWTYKYYIWTGTPEEDEDVIPTTARIEAALEAAGLKYEYEGIEDYG